MTISGILFDFDGTLPIQHPSSFIVSIKPFLIFMERSRLMKKS